MLCRALFLSTVILWHRFVGVGNNNKLFWCVSHIYALLTLMSGTEWVGVPDQLPVAGTDLSRGNDLARNECFLSPPEQPEILLLMCVFIAPLCCMHPQFRSLMSCQPFLWKTKKKSLCRDEIHNFNASVAAEHIWFPFLSCTLKLLPRLYNLWLTTRTELMQEILCKWLTEEFSAFDTFLL